MSRLMGRSNTLVMATIRRARRVVLEVNRRIAVNQT